MSKNDEKILRLKEQIAAKKATIGKAKRFSPKTSCSISIGGARYNLHAINMDQLIFLACHLAPLVDAADALGYPGRCVIDGFSVEDWLADVQAKIGVLAQKDEEAKLRAMEAKLDALLSEDKRTELELAEIEASLS